MAYCSQLSAVSFIAVSYQLFDNEVNSDSILVPKQELGNEGQRFSLAFAFGLCFS
jgi:hypothetical protein